MNTLFNTSMTNGDLETFYPFQMGVGKGAPNNFESSYDEDSNPELNDEYDDQENTDYENEAVEEGGIEETKQLPCFRQLVREKKKQLKDTYGKGKLSVGECGIQPIRTEPKYNPQVRIPKIYSPFKDCGLNPDLRPGLFKEPCVCTKGDCDCRLGTACCNRNRTKDDQKAQAWSEYTACRNEQGKLLNPGTENEDAWARAQDRFNADNDAWRRCRDENKGIWTPGWRRQWRKFKKSGGLKLIKQESTRCLLGQALSNEPILTPSAPLVAPVVSPVVTPTPTKQSPFKMFKIIDGEVRTKGSSNKDTTNQAVATNKSKYIIIIAIVIVVVVAAFVIYKIRKK